MSLVKYEGDESKWGCSRVILSMQGIRVEMWECDDCAALTRNPYRHNMWHVEEREHRP